MRVVAGTAIAPPTPANRVLVVVSVTARAVRPCAAHAVVDICAAEILSLGNRFEVARVAAPLIEAKVIDGEPCWNRAYKQFIRNAMGYTAAFAGDSVLAVAILVALAEPRPALAVVTLDVDVVPEVTCVNTSSSRAVRNTYRG